MWTIPSIVSRLMPDASAARKASSRLGPVCPCVPARASAWQDPHFCVNIALPLDRSGSSRPQAASGSATAAATSAATSGLTVFRARLTGREHYPVGERDGVDASRRPWAAAITPWATLSQRVAARRLGRQRRAGPVALGGSSVSQAISFAAICSTASGPRSNESSGRSSGSSAGASVRVTSARPECAADSGNAPQAAASAATMPNASGNVLGTTWASQAGSRSGRSSCSRRPVKCTRSAAAGAAASQSSPDALEERAQVAQLARRAALELAPARGDLARVVEVARASASTKRSSASR